jgi:hypothetical protein
MPTTTKSFMCHERPGLSQILPLVGERAEQQLITTLPLLIDLNMDHLWIFLM